MGCEALGGPTASSEVASLRVPVLVAHQFGAILFGSVLLGSAALQAEVPELPPASQLQIDFQQHVEPLFKNQCHKCHGQALQLAGLRLDSREAALAGGYSGPVVIPGNSAESRLIHLVAGIDEKTVMPLEGERLTPDQVGLLRAWIDQGAPWTEPTSAEREPAKEPATQRAKVRQVHWAFILPKRPGPPRVRDEAWVRNPIDSFVLARLEREGIRPSPEADRGTLIRRLNLDLIGLPPTPDEVDRFLRDNRPDAYERVVDRLLASPYYGEKWGRHWLDLARYADTIGYLTDNPMPHAWRYRHWVVDALNRNTPFDRFTIEQMAGDLLPNATVEQKLATGFHRNTLTNREGGLDLQQLRVEQVVDRTNTVGTVWLGLTLGCAQCHDHKYDPITQKDYYRFFAFFDSGIEVNIEAPLPGEMGAYLWGKPEYDRKRRELLEEYNVPALQAEWEKRTLEAGANPGDKNFPKWNHAWESLAVVFEARACASCPKWPTGGLSPSFDPDTGQGKAVTGFNPANADPSRTYAQDILRLSPEHRTQKEQDQLTDHFLEHYNLAVGEEKYEKVKFKELREKLVLLAQEYPPLSEGQTLAENPRPPTTHILIRGDFRQPGVEVRPGTPAFLNGMPSDPNPSRLTLARWLVSEENPLTARVAVNRIWEVLFGRGLVKTSENFGLRGEPPSHRQLLDWLATEFVAIGWDMKAMQKLIVESATYRQSSNTSRERDSADPENRLLARQDRLRLPAELIRDVTLAASGLLNPAIGGRSVYPPLPENVGDPTHQKWWKESKGGDRFRRGLYTFFQRTNPYPQLITFDAPDSLTTCSKRERSTVPQQALTLLNDPVFLEAAQALAARIIREKEGGDEDRLSYAYKVCLARAPSAPEKDRLLRYFADRKDTLAKDPEAVRQLFLPQGVDGIEPLEAAAWVGVSSILLNLDEFITRE